MKRDKHEVARLELAVVAVIFTVGFALLHGVQPGVKVILAGIVWMIYAGLALMLG